MTEANPSSAHWEHFPHGGDAGVRGRGPTAEAAFAEAARAMTAIITDPDTVAPKEWIDIECEAPDIETLFVDWLNALVFEMASRRMLFSRFHVHLDDGRLWARVAGEAVDPDRHERTVEIKGATFTCLAVRRESDGWLAQCVVDV